MCAEKELRELAAAEVAQHVACEEKSERKRKHLNPEEKAKQKCVSAHSYKLHVISSPLQSGPESRARKEHATQEEGVCLQVERVCRPIVRAAGK
jgi:hypothetical protein